MSLDWNKSQVSSDKISVPTVSVVMSVRNGGSDLPRAVACILDQTYRDFEFIIINNGSSDGSAVFLSAISDPRVRVYHQDDQGLAAALNRGISLARGHYIARQDHDDLALPDRIMKQARFLDEHQDHGLVGTCAEIWVGDQPTGRFHDHPSDDADLRFCLLFNNPFVHSSVMIRRSVLVQSGGYTTDPARQPPEDYELWSRIARCCRVANLPERLTIYREVPGSMSRAGIDPFKQKLVTISSENIAYAVGEAEPAEVHRDIAAIIHGIPDMVTGRTTPAMMEQILSAAGRRIGVGEGTLRDWSRRLMHHYYSHAHAARHFWSAVRSARSVLRTVRNSLVGTGRR
ncbi:glycosyltransferase family 2 protein [Nitrobacter sp. JJSN]|uniref:glycosyltransferase family 2 protein n=1 Tax=Nitrobacter sp. JJSN TaxID=3453033 RepID=UPI003F75991D